MKTTREIIEETAAFYNSNNRSVREIYNNDGDKDTECRYFGPDGKRCAFSRCCLETDEVVDFLAKQENVTAELVLKYAAAKGIEILKEEYRGHSQHFWNSLQSFHDTADYWDENGLSQEGEEKMINLLAAWGE